MSAITYEKLSKTGYSPTQLDKIIDIKKQLDILHQSIQADSIIKLSYKNYLNSLKIKVRYVEGMVDTNYFIKSLSHIGNIELLKNPNAFFLTPNTIKYSQNIPLQIVNYVALASIENQIGITLIEPFSKNDTTRSLIDITYDPKGLQYSYLKAKTILNNNSPIIMGPPNSSYGEKVYSSPPTDIKIEKTAKGYILSWTTPSESNLSEFEIRYDTVPISVSNFNNSYMVYNAPHPFAGRRQSVTISDLDRKRVYYFAIRIFNLMGQRSPIMQIHS